MEVSYNVAPSVSDIHFMKFHADIQHLCRFDRPHHAGKQQYKRLVLERGRGRPNSSRFLIIPLGTVTK
jgi:hypothetical protein